MLSREQLVDTLGGKTGSLVWYAQDETSTVPLLPHTIIPVVDGKADEQKLEEVVEKLVGRNLKIKIRASSRFDLTGLVDLLSTEDFYLDVPEWLGDSSDTVSTINGRHFGPSLVHEERRSKVQDLKVTVKRIIKQGAREDVVNLARIWDNCPQYRGIDSLVIQPAIEGQKFLLCEHPNNPRYLILDVVNGDRSRQHLIFPEGGYIPSEFMHGPEGRFSYNVRERVFRELMGRYKQNPFIRGISFQSELIQVSDKARAKVEEVAQFFDFPGRLDNVLGIVHLQSRNFFPYARDPNFVFDSFKDLSRYLGEPPEGLKEGFRDITSSSRQVTLITTSHFLARLTYLGFGKRKIRNEELLYELERMGDERADPMDFSKPFYFELSPDSAFGTFTHGTYQAVLKQAQNKSPFIIREVEKQW